MLMDSRLLKFRLFALMDKFEDKLIHFYMLKGPSALRDKLGLNNDDKLWKVVFDYLVFEKEAVKFCTRKFPDYTYSLFCEKGPEFVRKGFLIEDKEYDDAWEYVLDYVGISKGALYEFVNNNKNYFKELIYNGRASQIREELGLTRKKYDKAWEEILDILLECVSFDNMNISMFEHGLKLFSNLYNVGRTHRSLKNFKTVQ